MKLRASALVTLFALGLAAAFALVVPQSGHGRPLDTTTTGTTGTTGTTTTGTTSTETTTGGTTTTGTSTTGTTTTSTSTTTTTTNSAQVTAQVTSRAGTITALSAGSITVDSLTCALGSGSPPTSERRVGDRVGIVCTGGVLTVIYVYPSSTSTTATTGTTTTTGATTTSTSTSTTTTTSTSATKTTANAAPDVVTTQDAVLALSAKSITVGPLMCALTTASPSVRDVKVGDRVGVACSSNGLVKLVELPPLMSGVAPASLTVHGPARFISQLGKITSLTKFGVTVNGLACSLADGSPDLGGYKVGALVGIGCARGVLFMIGTLPRPTSGGETRSVKQALLQRYRACVKAGVSANRDRGPTCKIGDLLKHAKSKRKNKN